MDQNKEMVVTEAFLPALPVEAKKILTGATDQDVVYERKGRGGKTFSYIPGWYVTQKLNEAIGTLAWSDDWEMVTPWEFIGKCGQIAVKVTLTVHYSNGRSVSKSQVGSAEVKFLVGTKDPVDIGDDIKSACTDGLKKCASKFGVAADVYSGKLKAKPGHTKDSTSGERSIAETSQPASSSSGASARSGKKEFKKPSGNEPWLKDPISDKQKDMITKCCEQRSVKFEQFDKWVKETFGYAEGAGDLTKGDMDKVMEKFNTTKRTDGK